MSDLYCPYCLEPQGNKFQCCQENHFIPFDELDDEAKQIIEQGEDQ